MQTKNGAGIKKFFRILFYFIAGLLLCLVVSYALLHSPYVQTRLVKYFTDRIERATGVKIQVGGVDFRPMKSLVLNDVLLRDYRNDTLLYCKDFYIRMDSFRLSTRSFTVREVTLEQAYLNLWIERGERETVMNLDVFLAALDKGGASSEKTEKSGQNWIVGLGTIHVRNSRFVYREKEYEEIGYGINWTDVDCRHLNVDVSEMDFSGGKVGCLISDLSLEEKSGFIIRELDGRVEAYDSVLRVTESKIRTDRSELCLDKLQFNWTPNQRDWRYFTTRMQQYYKVLPSRVSFIDLAYFNEVLRGIDNTVTVSGVVSNTVNRIEGDSLKMEFGENSVMYGRFKSQGLPDFRNTVFDIDLWDTHLNPSDLETIYLPWFTRYIHIPAPLHKLKRFDVNGNFKGTIEDFVLHVNSQTPGLNGQLVFAYAPCGEGTEDCTALSGSFVLPMVDFGRLSGAGMLGNGRLNGSYTGKMDGERFEFNATGKVPSLHIRKGKVKDLDFYMTVDGDKMNVVSSVDNDSVQAALVLNYDSGKEVSFMSAKGYAEVHGLEDFGFSVAGGHESARTDFEMVYADSHKDSDFGNLTLSNCSYSGPGGYFGVDEISLENRRTKDFYTTTLHSDVLDLQIDGHYMDIRPLEFTDKLIRSYLPAYNSQVTGSRKKMQPDAVDFRYVIEVKDLNRMLKVIYPELSVSPGTKLVSNYGADKEISMTVNTDSVRYKDFYFYRSRMNLKGDEYRLKVVCTAEEAEYNRMGRLYNVRNELVLEDNRIDEKLVWCNWGKDTYSGQLAAGVKFVPSGRDAYKAEIEIYPGVIVIADSVWKVKASSIDMDGRDFTVRDFRIFNGEQYFYMNGDVSEDPEKSLELKLNRVDLAGLNRCLFDNRMNVFGMASGDVTVKDYYKANLLYSDIHVKNWGVNRDTLGSLRLMSYWDADSNKVIVRAENRVDDEVPLYVSGFFRPSTDSVDINIRLSKVGLDRLGIYAPDYFSESRGGLTGQINITGSVSQPDFTGYVHLDSVGVKPRNLNTMFFVNDTVYIERDRLLMKGLQVTDAARGKSVLSGYYGFRENRFDLDVTSSNFLLMNTGPEHNDSFYGTVYVSGLTRLNNRNGLLNVTVNARTENNSSLFLPLSSNVTEEDGNFLHFVSKNRPARKTTAVRAESAGMVLNANLELNDNLEVQIVFDPTIGDILKSRGNGDIKITLDKDGLINMFGEYKVSKGDYLFTLNNLLNKKFVLTPGGRITWNGSPYDATINLNAVYNLKTSLYELLADASLSGGGERSVKVPVECVLNLSDNFTNPLVKFDINFPTLDTQTKSFVQGLFSSQDEINKQMFSLLILNKFYTPDYMTSAKDIEERNAGYQAGVTTATELVSNQLSRWLSKISNNFDIGLSYRQGDNITTNEIALALSTQLLNDRVTISANGNMDVGGAKNVTSNSAGSSSIAGDFDVEVKLNKQGNLKLKAYSHMDEKIIYNATDNIQGMGVSYQEAFDTFRELLHKYFGFLKRKK